MNNNVVKCYAIPPGAEHAASWKVQIYVNEPPKKLFVGTKTLPSQIEPNTEVMDKLLEDSSRIPAKLVQLSDKNQVVVLKGETRNLIFPLLSMQTEAKRHPLDKKKEGVYLLHLHFAMHETKDVELIAEVNRLIDQI